MWKADWEAADGDDVAAQARRVLELLEPLRTWQLVGWAESVEARRDSGRTVGLEDRTLTRRRP